MNTLTIKLDDNVFSKLTAFARRRGKSAEEIVVTVTTEELAEIDALEGLEASQREAKARLTSSQIDAAFNEIRALKTTPLPGDELPSL
ncbi:MAG: hypothetical protein JWR15_4535 [Prosthecobacter sp.]|nr:hypothetical protein [Prosthecobacter sp.]